MYISGIRLQNFRTYHEVDFTFNTDITVVVGPNGSGKTNLLEALYMVGYGKSFRDSDEHLTMYDYDWWKIMSNVDGTPREVRYHDKTKQFRIGEKSLLRLPRAQHLPVVLFEPDDLSLIHGAPASRRRYIDQLITHITPGYTTTLRRYERVVAQRNTLLRHQEIDHDTLFVLDIMLAELAEVIVVARNEIIRQWNERLSQYYSYIADAQTPISVNYHTPIDTNHYKQSLLSHLKSRLNHDHLTGSTSHGPHRDDYGFFVNNNPFVTTASRGEVRTLILALKQHEVHMIDTYHSTDSLLLLDDVFSELDTTRQKKLLTAYYDHQTIITTTHVMKGMAHSRTITVGLLE
ncbi:DNA replication and repair protein RecF [Candidatus Saccharibacteria bacterium]|nr:DNA replication and repair protein RecF [Candidatus Saccharibacteria bacterium]